MTGNRENHITTRLQGCFLLILDAFVPKEGYLKIYSIRCQIYRLENSKMNDKQFHAFAVTTTAVIAVLRTSTIAMMALVMQKLSPDEREEVLAEIAGTIGDLPPDYNQESPVGTMFYEEVAAEAPELAKAFARDVRRALG
jgi:membrane-bound ClpP family serine protease